MLMAFRRQVIVSTVFIIMFILLMDKHMRFAISGEKINAEKDAKEKKQRQNFGGQMQIDGIRHSLNDSPNI